VIIPVRNEQGYIGRCLQALAAQDYPRDRFEVFVLDGGSTDATEYETQHTANAAGLTVFYAPNPGKTTATGFNLGLSLAHGEVIVKVDGHTRVAPDFLSANVRALRESGADAVGGPIETRGHGAIGRAIAIAMSSRFGVGDTAFRDEQAAEQWTDSVPFGAYRREVFERIGGFAEDVDRGEDDEFNYRLRQAGGRILLSPSIRSTYYCRSDLESLARQYWRYGLAKAKVLERHPGRFRARHMVPSALVATLASGALLSIVDRRFAWLTALAGGAYATAATAAALKETRGDVRETRNVALAFACIHLPAGAGMLLGLLRALLGRRTRATLTRQSSKLPIAEPPGRP
jgi:cellulose synthase/poly-beta-1,6-N-acetylglucosamine synthase-like glycosyltransferase